MSFNNSLCLYLFLSELCVSCPVLTVVAVWAPILASVPLTTPAPSASFVSITISCQDLWLFIVLSLSSVFHVLVVIFSFVLFLCVCVSCIQFFAFCLVFVCFNEPPAPYFLSVHFYSANQAHLHLSQLQPLPLINPGLFSLSACTQFSVLVLLMSPCGLDVFASLPHQHFVLM